jgi:hypothetical protein
LRARRLQIDNHHEYHKLTKAVTDELSRQGWA